MTRAPETRNNKGERKLILSLAIILNSPRRRKSQEILSIEPKILTGYQFTSIPIKVVTINGRRTRQKYWVFLMY